MASNQSVGSIVGLWRFPVKSMAGEQIAEAELTQRGIAGDRAYALIDRDTGKVVSAKSVRLYPDLFSCKARFVEQPKSDHKLPPVEISLPDGTAVTSDSGDADRVISGYFRRNVALAQVAPDDFTIDQYHPDIEGADPGGNRDTIVAQKLGAALFAELRMESPVAVGSFFDVFPLSVLTTSTLAKLSDLQPSSQFDLRRFRMNVIIDTEQSGFVENGWVGHELGIGDDVRIKVSWPDPRCVMTTLAQPNLPEDRDVLRTLVRHNRIQVGGLGQFPCAGVYAEVHTGGSLQTGDQVVVN